MKTIKLAIIEDEKAIRDSLRTFFGEHPGFEVTSASASVEDFLQGLKNRPKETPEIMLLDIQLPGMTGVEGISWIKKKIPEVEIIMLTTFENVENIFNALREGACSYLSKRSSLTNIRDAVTAVSRGGSYMSPSIARKVVQHFNPSDKKKAKLTPRQRQIALCIVDGLSYQEIGDKLFISIDTVRTHIKKIYKLLDVNSKTELIKKSLKDEL